MEDFNDFTSEYNDPDATACACGDYNTWEENQVFLDHEWDDYLPPDDYYNDLDYYAEEAYDLGWD
jgi:hypothetical protein